LPAAIFNIICCILFSATAFGQATLRGKVLNATSDKPLPGASVYLNNTSIGTVTDESGNFIIPNAINGELVISCVGYERILFPLGVDELKEKSFTFKLSARQSTLRDVMILSDVARKRYLQLFKANFLGLTEEADQSSILNLNAVNFSAAKEKNAFFAYSDTPLTIINKKLGYIIRFDLEEFFLNQKTGHTFFYGFTRYEEMGDKKRWHTNRRKAYYGSSMHFLRSLVKNELEKEHFSIFLLKQDTIRDAGGTTIVDRAFPADATNIVMMDSSQKKQVARWPGILMAQYNKNPSNKNYLSAKVFMPGNIRTGTRSYLRLNTGIVGIDKYGLLDDPMKVFFGGYWAYEKAANLLPYNYVPEND
jgi:hypothetical protein